MYAEIVSIGEELLSSESETVDTNSVYITRQLGALGIRVLYKTTVGDHEARITETLKAALARVDLVITTGGLGPTVDDMTRQGVAAAFGRGLSLQQPLLDDITEKFRRFGVRMSENNRVQAMLPDGAQPIHNPVGTAPGFIVTEGPKIMMSLPGVPREMKAMMEQTVLPHLQARLGGEVSVQKTRVLRTAGIGESLIDEQIGHLEHLQNPTVGLNAHSGQTDIRITARTTTAEEANALIATVEAEIREKLGEFIYGVDRDPLEGAFMTLLRNVVGRLTLVEIGTDGLLRRRIESQPGASELIHVLSGPALDEISARFGDEGNGLEPRQVAEQIAQSLLQQVAGGLVIVLIARDTRSAVCVRGGDEVRSRGYGYNLSQAAPEWASGWALSMGWHLLKTLEARRADSHP
ncbi:MAG: CinA family nicotinamide mononucleotide deamidase-related protein [Anaerolineae bacterium]|nr:CinA family nicotinamide mononucleotide deamidase-related protein [Anaerolineae bacterium]